MSRTFAFYVFHRSTTTDNCTLIQVKLETLFSHDFHLLIFFLTSCCYSFQLLCRPAQSRSLLSTTLTSTLCSTKQSAMLVSQRVKKLNNKVYTELPSASLQTDSFLVLAQITKKCLLISCRKLKTGFTTLHQRLH